MSSIGSRLKKFAEDEFGSVASMAKHFKKSRNYFQAYVNDKSVLGGEMLAQLHKVNCDLNWLITGSKTSLELKAEAKHYYKLYREHVESSNKKSEEIWMVNDSKAEYQDEAEMKIEELQEEISDLRSRHIKLKVKLRKYEDMEQKVFDEANAEQNIGKEG